MKTVVFDLDNTLTESKLNIDDEMSNLLHNMLLNYNVAIVSGASWKQMSKQLLSKFDDVDYRVLHNLYLLPSSGGSFYQLWFGYGWLPMYENMMTNADYDKIHSVLDEAVKSFGYTEHKTWGKTIEDKESLVTFSGLGGKAPLSEKQKWDPDYSKRRRLVSEIAGALSMYDITMGGLTSVDICLKGINKKFGMDQLMKSLAVSKDEVVYVGDSIFHGGNNYFAVEMGLEYACVKSPEETKMWIKRNLAV